MINKYNTRIQMHNYIKYKETYAEEYTVRIMNLEIFRNICVIILMHQMKSFLYIGVLQYLLKK
jgi:hypothetical protein